MWSVLSNNRKKYEQLNLGTVLDYEKYNMISIIYHSTKIEGCALTETDTRVLLEKDITAKGKPLKDHLMVKDHYDALLYLKRVAEQKQLLSVELIKTTCSVLMKNTGEIIHSALGSVDTSKGELRQVQVYVDRKYFPDFSKVPALLDHLITKTNERLETVSDENDILRLAADVHYSLVNIHPFYRWEWPVVEVIHELYTDVSSATSGENIFGGQSRIY